MKKKKKICNINHISGQFVMLNILVISKLFFIKNTPILQPARFKLNHQSTRLVPGERDCSIWVGDLTPEVDDLELFKFFAARFDTVRTAKGEFVSTSNLFFVQLFENESIIYSIARNSPARNPLPTIWLLMLSDPEEFVQKV